MQCVTASRRQPWPQLALFAALSMAATLATAAVIFGPGMPDGMARKYKPERKLTIAGNPAKSEEAARYSLGYHLARLPDIGSLGNSLCGQSDQPAGHD